MQFIKHPVTGILSAKHPLYIIGSNIGEPNPWLKLACFPMKHPVYHSQIDQSVNAIQSLST